MLSSLLFGPPLCGGCGKAGTWWCENCWKQVCWYDYRLSDPLWTYPTLRFIQSATEYYPPVSTLIHHIKYDFWWRYTEIAAMLIDYRLGSWISQQKIDSLVPVPLHSHRQAWRGFNQAEHIACHLSKLWGVPVVNALQRTVFRHSQAGLQQQERHSVQHAFSVKPTYREKSQRLLLIDDVITTGSTLSGCTRALEILEPHWIGAVSLARA